MKKVCGFWLPEREEHLVPFLQNGPIFAGGPTYQLHKLMPAMKFVKNFGHAVDVGAHCGLWSRPLSAMFNCVSAFEPIKEHLACFRANVANEESWKNRNVRLWEYALGETEGMIKLTTGANSSGDTYCDPDGEHEAMIARLDDCALPHGIDFLKLDCEGFEYFALKGGEKTIREDKPVIIVEQKPGKGQNFGLAEDAAVKLLQEWGAHIRYVISGDYCLSWN